MVQRTLIAAAVLALAGCLAGCGKKKSEPKPAAAGDQAAEEKAKAAWQPGEDAVPTGEGRTELEKIAVNYRQLEKLLKRKKLPFRSIESLGWRISRKARNLVDGFENVRKEKAQAAEDKVPELKAQEQPEYPWSKWPQGVKDLDLVAINAKRLALAAGSWNEESVREKFANLQKAAGRCLPAPPPPPESAQPTASQPADTGGESPPPSSGGGATK
jgi:hypothetical protein